MATSNPAFSSELFSGYGQVYGVPRASATTMTVQGTVGKTFALLAVLSAAAIWAWGAATQHRVEPLVLPVAGLGAFGLAIFTLVKPHLAPWTAPVYAAFEGVLLGLVSYQIEASLGGKNGVYSGIAMQAVAMTCGTLFCMLFAYRTGLIRVTDKLRAGIVSATGAIALFYLVAMVLRLFGVGMPFLHAATPLGIGISLVIVGVAAFNLLLDFDSIENGARNGAPKFMEWFSAFGLLLTLVWLYLEILMLLRQLQGRSDNR